MQDRRTRVFAPGNRSGRGKKPIITVLKELHSQSEITGMWTNITDEDIEKADDTIQDPNEGMPGMGGMFDAPGGDGNGPEDGESQKRDKPQETGELAQKNVWRKEKDNLLEKRKEAPISRETTDKKPWVEAEHPRNKDGKFGTKVEVDSETINRYNRELTGTKTSDGKTISRISGHATGRFIERGISAGSAKEVLTSSESKIYSGHTNRTTCYEKDGIRVVVDHVKGNIVSVMRRRRRKNG